MTDRYQTTIPEIVGRPRSGRARSSQLTVMDDGSVVISRDQQDPVLAPLLELLAQEIAAHPERLQVVPESLLRRIDDLVGTLSSTSKRPSIMSNERREWW